MQEKKELTEQSGKFVGELQQALLDALNKKANEIFEREGYDRAYWRFDIKLTMDELDANFTETLHTTIIESKNIY